MWKRADFVIVVLMVGFSVIVRNDSKKTASSSTSSIDLIGDLSSTDLTDSMGSTEGDSFTDKIDG